MFGLLGMCVHLIDVSLLQPITYAIETFFSVIYYFLAGSCFIGYCLIEAAGYIWRWLCDGYESALNLFIACRLSYYELRYTVSEVFDYFYEGTGDSLRLADRLSRFLLKLLSDFLIGLGNLTLWILMLLPRAIIAIIDYIIDSIYAFGVYIFDGGIILLNNLFRLSIGIALLLVLYMFRGYVRLYAMYLLRKLRTEISTKMNIAHQWMVLQFYRVMQAFQISSASQNGGGSPNRTACVICLDRSRNIVILPCRHLCLCTECSQQLYRMEGGKRCPVCRHSVDIFMPVYS